MSTASFHEVTFSDVAAWTDTPVTYLHLPALEVAEPDITQEYDSANENSSDGMMSVRYPTVKNAKATYTTRIHPGTTANGNGEAANTPFMSYLLSSYFNMATPAAGSGTTVSSGGPGNSVAITVASATGINVGDMLIFAAAGGAGVAAEMAVVISKSGAALTLDRDLSTAANYAASAVVYKGFDYHPTLAAYANALYVNHRMDGHGWLQGPGKITGFKIGGLTSREGLRYIFDYQARNWAAGVTPSFTANPYSGNPLVAVGSPCWIAGTQTVIADMSVDFGAKIEDIKATSDSTGVSGMELVSAEPSGEITSYYSSTRFTEYQAATGVPLMIWVGNGATDNAKARASIGIYVPNAQIDVKEARVQGQRGLKLAWRGKRPTTTQVAAGFTAPIYLTVFGGI